MGNYAAQFPPDGKGEAGGFRGRETPGREKEDPIEDEGFGKSGYGCLLFCNKLNQSFLCFQ
jgi:hypothetical protein